MSCLRRHVGLFGPSAAVLAAVWWAAGAAEVVVAQSVAVPVTGVAQVAGPANKGTPAPAPAPAPVAPPIYPQVGVRQPSQGYRSVPLTATEAEGRARAAVDAALAKAHDDVVEFNETPLREALVAIGRQWNVHVHTDQKALEEAGMELDAPVVHIGAKGESLRGVLQSVLDQLDLTWGIRGERLVVTTTEKAAEMLATRLYPLPLGTANPPVDFQSLIDTITNTVGGPGVWADQGGNGQIRPAEGGEPLLVILQTEAIHGEIEALLRGMHERALAEFLDATGQPRRTPVVRMYRCTDKNVRDELVAKLADLCNASLAGDGDPAAKVGALAENLVVQSAKADFHALAAQIVAATVGVQPRQPRPTGNFCGGMGMGSHAP